MYLFKNVKFFYILMSWIWNKRQIKVLFEWTGNQNKLNKINPQNFIEECKDIGEQIHYLKCFFFSLNSVQSTNCEYIICKECREDIKECLLCESKFVPKKKIRHY